MMLRLADLARRVRAMFPAGVPSGLPAVDELVAPLLVDEEGWLEGVGVTRIPSHPSWHYPRLSTPTGDPVAIVAHTSATGPGTALAMAQRRARARTEKDRAASWHLSVEADGSIWQMISCEAGAWHAKGAIRGAGPANRVSVGIELIGWERGPWPDAQVVGAARVWRALVQSYGIRREFAMVPHAVIDPADRSDPGKLWMREHAPDVLAFAYAR